MPYSHKGYGYSPIEKKIFKIVEETIKNHRMFELQDSVLVGVSGGPDSVALLHVLLKIASRLSLTLGVAHLNHEIRSIDSDRDAEFVASLAGKLKLPFYIKKKDVLSYKKHHKLSLEEASRRVRYEFFHQIAGENKYNKIALGHQGNDNAELVLMYLFRGSGPPGISGIPPVRGNSCKYGIIVRPFLGLTRHEIMDYLAEKNLEYVTDTSNEDTKFLRNKVRSELIPLLKESYNPRIIETINRLSSIIRSDEEWIEDIITPFYEDTILYSKEKEIALSIPKLVQTHMAPKRRVIRRAIENIKGDLRCITFSHIASVIKLIERVPAFGSLDLPDTITVTIKGDTLYISSGEEVRSITGLDPENIERPLFEYTIHKPGLKPESLCIKETGFRLRLSVISAKKITDIQSAGQQVAFFDMNSLAFPLIVRNFRHGDRFTPFGMTGSQKLKKFFINNKISRTKRANCPVLLSGDKIIWVVGHRQDEFGKITQSTGNVLKVQLSLA
ncbi:MAG: tRNA lysidine(34) synthetase TilS [Desulfobacteraceae bacterium 4572_187]|nr:MAG: tRNA lysidine(34) synthetase TilS [Desulfobacteraceae bacterium 4572_187]